MKYIPLVSADMPFFFKKTTAYFKPIWQKTYSRNESCFCVCYIDIDSVVAGVMDRTSARFRRMQKAIKRRRILAAFGFRLPMRFETIKTEYTVVPLSWAICGLTQTTSKWSGRRNVYFSAISDRQHPRLTERHTYWKIKTYFHDVPNNRWYRTW